ncbi:MAG: hypothetical protein L0211_05070 [Planctomycetaceae bacterium]|nr:hypothetical protein [Planctomycetaceae bacterium]
MRVPENAKGKAKITLSFLEWKEGNVAPATFEVPIEDPPQPKKKAQPTVDLTKVDRSIAKEPVYKNKPKYCLLVFGPEAKIRVWLVQDGDKDSDVMYVDRNGNGDLTEEGERLKGTPDSEGFLFSLTLPAEIAGDWRWIGLTRRYDRLGGGYMALLDPAASANYHYVAYYQSLVPKCCYRDVKLSFADWPQEAPIIHVGGPLAILLDNPRLTLPRGRESLLAIHLGTPGVGQGTTVFPGDERPGKARAELRLPGRKPREKPVILVATLKRDE